MKTLALFTVLALSSVLLHAQTANGTPVIQKATTTYPFTGITQANLAATITTASSETPATAGQVLTFLTVNKNPITGLYSVTAIYR